MLDPNIAAFMGLHDYQVQAANFALSVPKCGLFLKMGLGKSRITLAVIAQLNPPSHILLIAPKNIARSSWIEEIHKIGLNIRYKSLLVNERGKKLTKQKRHKLYEEAFDAPPTLYFINRDLVGDIVDYYGDRWPFPFLIIDELQSFKGYKSGRFKCLKQIQPYVTRLIGLTGTPRPNSLEDLWSEIYLMDGGWRLGRTITAYREAFLRPGYGKSASGYPYDWIPLPGSKEIIYQRIQDIVISMESRLNTPPVTYNNVYAYMDDEQIAQYRQMARDSVFQYGQTEEEIVAACSAGVLQQKLLQMASGCMYVDKDHNYITLHAAKIEALQYIYDNEPDNLLVGYFFNTDLWAIREHFPDAVVFDGSPEMQAEWNAGKIRMLLVQPASAGHGLNIQFGGHTLVWYTLPWSLEFYQQLNARLDRQGQTQPVVIHHLLTKHTIDEHVLDVLQNKDSEQEDLMSAVRFILSDEPDVA